MYHCYVFYGSLQSNNNAAGQEQWTGLATHQGRWKRGAKPHVDLQMNDQGWPQLLDTFYGLSIPDSQCLVRSFVRKQYQVATKGTQLMVPWTNIAETPTDFINRQYLPEEVHALKEPSRMWGGEALLCLAHWQN